MATIIDLALRGVLTKLNAELDHGVQELRRIYMGPKLAAWIQNALPTLESETLKLSRQVGERILESGAAQVTATSPFSFPCQKLDFVAIRLGFTFGSKIPHVGIRTIASN